MAEEWRVTIALDDAPGGDADGSGAASVTSREMRKRDRARRRRTRDFAREMRNRLGGAVIAPDVPSGAGFSRLLERVGSLDDSPVRVYLDSRAAAEAAAQVAREVAGQHGLSADVAVECWHPLEERWEDAAATSGHDRAEEERISRDRQQQEERRVSAETGIAQWQVRAELRTHRDTVTLAQRLSDEGHPITRGWKFLVAGADSEDDAHRLAETIRMYSPADAKIHVRPNIPVGGGIPTLPGYSG